MAHVDTSFDRSTDVPDQRELILSSLFILYYLDLGVSVSIGDGRETRAAQASARPRAAAMPPTIFRQNRQARSRSQILVAPGGAAEKARRSLLVLGSMPMPLVAHGEQPGTLLAPAEMWTWGGAPPRNLMALQPDSGEAGPSRLDRDDRRQRVVADDGAALLDAISRLG